MSHGDEDVGLALSGILLLGLDPACGPYIYHQHPTDITADRSDRSIFSTFKNFTEVFLPRVELTGRVCWHYEADTTHLVMYVAMEFSGVHYSRNLLKATVCFVFDCPSMMTTSSTVLEDALRSYAVALLNVAELLKDLEKRYGYLFHYFDPRGDYYDAQRCLLSSFKKPELQPPPPTATMASLVGTIYQSTASPSSGGGGPPRVLSPTTTTTTLVTTTGTTGTTTTTTTSADDYSPPAVSLTPPAESHAPATLTITTTTTANTTGGAPLDIATSPLEAYTTSSSLDASYSLPAALLLRTSSEERPIHDGKLLHPLGLTPTTAAAVATSSAEGHPVHLDPGDILFTESYEVRSGGTASTAVPTVTPQDGTEQHPSSGSAGGCSPALLRRIYYGSSRRSAHDQSGGANNNNTNATSSSALLQQQQPSPAVPPRTHLTPSDNYNPRRLTTLPLSRASASDLHEAATAATADPASGAHDFTTATAAASGTFVDLYDLCFIMEKALDCVLEVGDSIPISERSSVTVRCGKRHGTGSAVRPLYPDQRVVPIVSPEEVLAWSAMVVGDIGSPAPDRGGHHHHNHLQQGSPPAGGRSITNPGIAATTTTTAVGTLQSPQRVWTGWSDLTVTDVYEGIDGVRTVEEVISYYCRTNNNNLNQQNCSGLVEPWVWEVLYELQAPSTETPTAGCKRGGGAAGNNNSAGGGGRTPTSSLEPNFSNARPTGRQAALHQRKSKIRAAKRLASMADINQAAARASITSLSSSFAAPTSPSIQNIPRRVLYGLEALQHLQQCNWIMVLDPITSSSVYVCTPQLYAVMSSTEDGDDVAIHDALGRRLLAVNDALLQINLAIKQQQQQKLQQYQQQNQQGSSPAPEIPPTSQRGGVRDAAMAQLQLEPSFVLSRRLDSAEVISDGTWEGMTPMKAIPSTQTANFSPSARSLNMATPPPLTVLPATISTAAPPAVPALSIGDEIVDTPSERRRIGNILNLAAQQGYPPLSLLARCRRMSTPPTNMEMNEEDFGDRTPPECDVSQQNQQVTPSRHTYTDEVASTILNSNALDEQIELATSAAFRALVRFQYCSVASVTAEMRRCPFWGEWFSSWAPEVMVALVEFGVMNGWLFESDGS